MLPGSLAGLVDLGFDVLDGGQLGDAGLRLLVGHLGGRGGEVLVALRTTPTVTLSRLPPLQGALRT